MARSWGALVGQCDVDSVSRRKGRTGVVRVDDGMLRFFTHEIEVDSLGLGNTLVEDKLTANDSTSSSCGCGVTYSGSSLDGNFKS
jgi:hypothetical protein